LGDLGTGSAQTSTLQTTGDEDPVGCSPTAEQATAGEPSEAIDPAAHQPVITAEGAVERSRVHRPSHLGVASSNGGSNSSPRTSSSVADRREIQGDPTTEGDAEPPGFLASGQEPPSVGGGLDAVEAALAAAMSALGIEVASVWESSSRICDGAELAGALEAARKISQSSWRSISEMLPTELRGAPSLYLAISANSCAARLLFGARQASIPVAEVRTAGPQAVEIDVSPPALDARLQLIQDQGVSAESAAYSLEFVARVSLGNA